MNFGSTHEGREVIGFWMHGEASYTELRRVFKLLDIDLFRPIRDHILKLMKENAQQLLSIALFTQENGFPQLFVGHLSMNIFAAVNQTQKTAIHIF